MRISDWSSDVCSSDLRAPASGIEIVGPGLHHLGTVLEIQRMVVCGTGFVLLLMRQLQFDVVMVPALLMQDGRGHTTKAVSRHAAAVAHSVQRVQDRKSTRLNSSH